jgi:LacI family transcriptional regulator
VSPPQNEKRSVSLPDVATEAGVSTATAARALGGYGSVSRASREQVLAAAARLGYSRNELASSMITGRTSSIGLVLGDIENYFFSALARSVIDAAKARGYDVLVTNTDENIEAERTAVRVLQERRVDGLIVAPVFSSDSAHLARLTERGTPLVIVNGTIASLDIDCIIGDNVVGAGTAVDHLLSLGHRDIAIVFRSSGVPGAPMSPALASQSGSERVTGYRRSLERAGVTPRLDYQRGGGLRIEDAEIAVNALLDLEHPPTAIVTTNSVIVLGLLRALAKRGLKVPLDMSVVNFDDPPWAAQVAPPLTTVAQPTKEMGELAVELLCQRLGSDGGPPGVHRLPTTMQLRESTRRLTARRPARPPVRK